MANTKTSALPGLTGAATAVNDVVAIDDVSATTLKQITLAELAVAIATHGALATDAELAAAVAGKQDASTAATDAELTAHTSDASDAHAASAISVLDTAGDFTSTDVEGVLAELQTAAETTAGQLFTHLVGTADMHDASAISVVDGTGYYTGVEVEAVLAEVGGIILSTDSNLNDHLSDTANAHGASAIGNIPAGTVTATDVQAAINQVAGMIAGGGIPATIVDAAGDLIVATAADTVARLAKGANNTMLATNAAGTVAWADPRALPQAVNAQTGTSYTLVLSDAGKMVTANNAGTVTLTVPPASSVAFAPGTSIDLAQYGAGQLVIVGGSGVVVQTASTLKLRTQWSAATLVLSATGDTWFLVGDLEPLGQGVNAQSGTTYTFGLSDSDKLLTFANASAITATVPANATTAFPIGTHIDMIQTSTGQLTIAPAATVNLLGTPTLKARAQYSGLTLVKAATNGWYLLGDLAAT